MDVTQIRALRRGLRPIDWATASLALAMALMALLASPRLARADATTYSAAKRVFKVGILLIDSTTVPGFEGRGAENPDPYIFHIADSRSDIKPQNWEFINPLAPKTVTTDVYNRWSNPGSGSSQGRDPRHPYAIGAAVTKNMACYWEVSLSRTSLADLLQFDLLFLTNHRLVRLSPADREKLRKLVDAGGIVWIEDCGGMRLDPSGPFFLNQLQFLPSGGGALNGPVINVPDHPLLNSPYALTLQEIGSLGDKNYRGCMVSIANPSLPPNPEVLVNVVGNVGIPDASGRPLPYIAVGSYGAGLVIATASDSGCDINDYVGGVNIGSGGNSGAFSGENLQAAQVADLKFLYNAVQLGSSNSTYRRNNRRTAAAFESVGAPLLPSFDFLALGTPNNSIVASLSAPLVARDMIFVTGRRKDTDASTIRAFSAKPSLTAGDLGMPDLALGAPYDEVWRWDADDKGTPSAPVLGTVFNGAGYTDIVFVTLSDGRLVGFPARPTDAAGNLLAINTPLENQPAPVGAPDTYEGMVTASGAPGAPPAPVFFENRVYVAQPDGLVRCVDARTMQTLWVSYAQAQTPSITPVGTPTVGFTRQVVRGGVAGTRDANLAARSNGNTNDLMFYLPVRQSDGVATILAYWLGTRNEVVTVPEAGNNGLFRTRVAVDSNAPANNLYFVALGAPFITPEVRVYTNTYDSATGRLIASATENLFAGRTSGRFSGAFRTDGSGFVEVKDASGNPPTRGEVDAGGQPDNAILSVDYDVTYVTPGATPQVPGGMGTGNGARQNQPLALPGYVDGLETLAMSTEDLLLYAVRQTLNVPAGPGESPKVSFLGTHEQFGTGATKLRQSFTVLEGVGPIDTPVGDFAVVEMPTLRNRLQFAARDGGFGQGTNAALIGGALGWEGLTDVRPIGPLVAAPGGVAYQLARAQSPVNGVVAVLMAFKTDGEVVLSLPEAYTPSSPVTVQQFNGLSLGSGQPAQVVTAVLPASGANNVATGLQMTGDAQRGRITITDLRNPSGARFSTSQTFVVTYTPVGGQAPRTVFIAPTPTAPSSSQAEEAQSGDTSPRIIGGGFTPLLWYYVLPVVPRSAPTLIGGSLYFTSSGGLIAVSANPAASDPSVRVGFGEQVLHVVNRIGATDPKVNHVQWVNRDSAGALASAEAPPTGSQEVLAVNTPSGTFAFQNRVTLVADSKRLIEVDAGGAALWTLDATLDYRVVGGETPVYGPEGEIQNPPATGRIAPLRQTITRPSVARKLSASDYLIADTGNNRVVRVDRAGRLHWQLDRLSDPFGILKSADARSLSSPTDVQLYLMPTPDPSNPLAGAPIGYEAHYLIADAGNYRILEVVDYFDRGGRYRAIPLPDGSTAPGRQVVVWVSRTASRTGRKLRYSSVQRILTVGADGKYGRPTLVAVVSNSDAVGGGGSAAADFTGGSLVQLDYQPYNSVFPLRDIATGSITGLYAPWLLQGGIAAADSEPTGNGGIQLTLNEVLLADGSVRRITRPTYFQQITLPDAASPTRQKAVYLVCDATGVYEVEPGPTGRVVTWSFTQEDYNAMNLGRLGLPAGTDPSSLPRWIPTAVKRLANGNYLITNSASGPSRYFGSGQFTGEVLEVRRDRTFGAFSAPSIQRVGNTNEQRMGGSASNTNLLEQPLFADRL